MTGENNGIRSLAWQCLESTCRLSRAESPVQKHPVRLCDSFTSCAWCRHGEVEGGLSGVGILPSSSNKDRLAEGIPVTKILRSRSQTEKRKRQEEGLGEK